MNVQVFGGLLKLSPCTKAYKMRWPGRGLRYRSCGLVEDSDTDHVAWSRTPVQIMWPGR